MHRSTCALTNFSSLSATAASKIEIAFNFLQNPHRKVISNFQLVLGLHSIKNIFGISPQNGLSDYDVHTHT